MHRVNVECRDEPYVYVSVCIYRYTHIYIYVYINFSKVTGDLYEDEVDDAGLRMATAASEFSFWIPATFDCCQVGQGKTWTQVSGSRSRIDYFLLSGDILH